MAVNGQWSGDARRRRLRHGICQENSPQTLLALGLSVSAVGTLGIGWSTSVIFTMLLLVINGFFYPTIHIGINTMILNNTEGPYIGRVGGALTPIYMGMMVLGMSIGDCSKTSCPCSPFMRLAHSCS